MLDFFSNRLQKTMRKIQAKRELSEADILEVTREIKMSLLEADVNLLVVKAFIKNVKKKVLDSELVGKLNPYQQMVKIVKEELVEILGSSKQEINIHDKLTIVMMVGLQGSGKTTTSAKVTKFLMKKKRIKKPLLVAADIYRPAAIKQLQTLGKELQIDVFAIDNKTSPVKIVKEAKKKAKEEGYDFLLIDTAGRLSINEELMQELVEIKKEVTPNEILFVADTLSGQDIINVAKTFNEKLSLTGSIITKLDSDARGGAALSIRQILKIPIKFIGTGEKTSALDLFHPDRMANKILGMGDVLSLIEKAEDVIDEKKAKRMMNRMSSGKFDLNDLLDQLLQMKKLGKMSKLIKMIPGMSGKINQNQLNSAENKFKLFEIIISSTTEKERRSPKLLKQSSRKQRIMKGSGRSAQEYNSLINEFERMSKQMKEMSKQMKNGTMNPSMFRM